MPRSVMPTVADGDRQSSQHAAAGCLRRCLLVRVGRQLVLVGGQSLSLGDIRQQRSYVCDVVAEQDGERGRVEIQVSGTVQSGLWIEIQVSGSVQSRLPITVPGLQLPEDIGTLRAVLLRAVFLRRTTRLRQLSGCRHLTACRVRRLLFK